MNDQTNNQTNKLNENDVDVVEFEIDETIEGLMHRC
jgi:hypothetical protein